MLGNEHFLETNDQYTLDESNESMLELFLFPDQPPSDPDKWNNSHYEKLQIDIHMYFVPIVPLLDEQ
jgi:hypothetical protein